MRKIGMGAEVPNGKEDAKLKKANKELTAKVKELEREKTELTAKVKEIEAAAQAEKQGG